MKEVWDILDGFRGVMRLDELPTLLLVEAARNTGKVPEMHGGTWKRWEWFSQEKAYPQLQAAAQTLLGLPPRERLAALDVVFENCHRGRMGDNLWVAFPAARQIARLVQGASSVRCSFGWSLHPALHIAVEAAADGRTVELSFIDRIWRRLRLGCLGRGRPRGGPVCLPRTAPRTP